MEIPVCYGGAYGPDLPFVADYLGIPENEVVESHTAQKYLVYFLGFAPCFPMLQAPDELAGIPRLEYLRTKVPAGLPLQGRGLRSLFIIYYKPSHLPITYRSSLSHILSGQFF